MVHAAGAAQAALQQQQQQIAQQSPSTLTTGTRSRLFIRIQGISCTNRFGFCLFLLTGGSQQQNLTPAQAVQQQLRLQRLQLEQDRLRQRQQEIIAMVLS